VKIAVSAAGKTLDSQVDRRFGRCSYFLIVDSESMSFDVMTNEAAGAMGGAGIQAAQALTSRGVKTVITGNVGPNAFQTLSAAKIAIVAGASGSVQDVIQKFNSGELSTVQGPTVREHSGMNQGMRRGQGGRRSNR
jgi:predicted Fe-Mo cluster-binding NifX family protein